MKKIIWTLFICGLLVGTVNAANLICPRTDGDNLGKSGAGFGTAYITGVDLTDGFTVVSTNEATTNTIITVDGEVDGETLEDNSVDDDAIDFDDVTGADLTLTDCGAVKASDLGDSSVASVAVVTNGQAVSLSGVFVRLNSSGGTNLATNTITLSALASGENGMFVVINTGTSNLLAIAQTGTFKSPAMELTYQEACVIVASVSNEFYVVTQ